MPFLSKTILPLASLCLLTAGITPALAKPVSSLDSPWGSAKAATSSEHRFLSRPSIKLELDGRSGGVWFNLRETDWSRYSELVFTLHNPKIDLKTCIIMLANESSGANAIRLPDSGTLPGGYLAVPKESQRTFRLDLTNPELRKAVDIKNVRRIHLFGDSPETIFYLDGFTLRTADEVAAEARVAQEKRIAALDARLEKLSIPTAFQENVKRLQTAIQALPVNPPAPEKAEPLFEELGALLTILELMDDADGGRAFGVIPASSMTKVFREDALLPEPGATTLAAAGNERVSFQAVVVPFRPLQRVEITASPLTRESGGNAEIKASEVTVNAVGYVHVRHAFYYASSREGWWPDPLLPATPLDLQGRIQPYWITVHVPENQPPGVYKGALTFRAEGAPAQTLPYQITVWDFSLPVRGKLQNVISFTYVPADEKTRREVYATLLNYRINPINMYINGSVQTGDQPVRSDLEFCLERGLNTLVLWNPYDASRENPYDFSDAYLDRMYGFIAGYEPELRRLGAWEMSMILGFDEITHGDEKLKQEGEAGAKRVLDTMRQRFPGLKVASIGGPPLPATLTGPDNIWIPGTGILEPKWSKEFERIRSQKGSSYYLYWVYNDPSFMLDLPGIAPRWLSWLAFKHGAAGISYYSTIRDVTTTGYPNGVDWPRQETDVENLQMRGRNGCGILVYPARDGTIYPSIRLANTRDGIEDYEMMAILRDLLQQYPDAKAAKLLELPDSFLTHEKYSKDPEVLLAHRRKVAEAIERLKAKD